MSAWVVYNKQYIVCWHWTFSSVYRHQNVKRRTQHNLIIAATCKYETAHCCWCADELFICTGDLCCVVCTGFVAFCLWQLCKFVYWWLVAHPAVRVTCMYGFMYVCKNVSNTVVLSICSAFFFCYINIQMLLGVTHHILCYHTLYIRHSLLQCYVCTIYYTQILTLRLPD